MITYLRSRISLRALSLSLVLASCSATRSPTVPDPATAALAEVVRAEAHPLTGGASDYDPLLALAGDARAVLLGEATHGTHEFYRERARITQRLVEEEGFTIVAVEADWPRAYRVNRYVRGIGEDASAEQALGSFTEFPRWMWRNAEVRDLAQWLRARNQANPQDDARVGFYGLDLYSIFLSIEEVVGYLERVDAQAAQQARGRYACFNRFGADPVAYGRAVTSGSAPSCETPAREQLEELQRRAAEQVGPDDDLFNALQNARVVKNGEEYYRVMFTGSVASWNLRDRHMAETLDALLRHFAAKGVQARAVVWEHNSHIGDARATEMGEQGEWNLGQLAREAYGEDAVLVGFTTYTGTVLAASEWGGAPERKRVRPALPESYEFVLHATEIPSFLLLLNGGAVGEALRAPRLERAIGVLYLPQTERASHYFRARLSDQFDAVIHWDETRALEPLR